MLIKTQLSGGEPTRTFFSSSLIERPTYASPISNILYFCSHSELPQPMGVYGGSTFHQGDPVTPEAHAAPSSSSCVTTSTIKNGFFISGTSIGTVPPTSAAASVTTTPAVRSTTIIGADISVGPGSSSSFLASSPQGSVGHSSGASSSATGAAATSGAIPLGWSGSGWERIAFLVGSSVAGVLLGGTLVAF